MVAWLPVPKAIPGSMVTQTPSGAFSHGGTTHERGPTCKILWCAHQAVLQSCAAISMGGSAPSVPAASSARSCSSKCAMARPRPGGRSGVPGISSMPGS